MKTKLIGGPRNGLEVEGELVGNILFFSEDKTTAYIYVKTAKFQYRCTTERPATEDDLYFSRKQAEFVTHELESRRHRDHRRQAMGG